jgi:hypothetical protein
MQTLSKEEKIKQEMAVSRLLEGKEDGVAESQQILIEFADVEVLQRINNWPLYEIRILQDPVYNRQQMDFLRYHRVDCQWSWAAIEDEFHSIWKEHQHPVQPLNTRHDTSKVKALPSHWIPRIIEGVPYVESISKGKSDVTWGETLYFPHKLIELFPHHVWRYSWVSIEDKEKACRIMEEDEIRRRTQTCADADPHNGEIF